MRGLRLHRGVALPAVVLVLAALGMMAALMLTDALQAVHLARYAEGQVAARASAVAAVESLRYPDALGLLCLRPPGAAASRTVEVERDGAVTLRWWHLGHGRVRAEVAAVVREGGAARLLVRLRVDSAEVDDAAIGCPRATRLDPDGLDWLLLHPAG